MTEILKSWKSCSSKRPASHTALSTRASGVALPYFSRSRLSRLPALTPIRMEVPLRVAVMGCVVNGPGEAREADLGVASGNGKGQIFVRGEVIKTVKEADIVETLIDEAMRLAESMPAGDGVPEVSVR